MYSKINVEDAPLRTQTDAEPGVRMLGYELKARGDDRPKELRFNYFEYDAGDVVRRHKQKEQEEVFYVIEGEGTMEVDGDEFEMRAGDCIVVDPGPFRELRAETEMRIFAVGAPNIADDAVFEDEL
ncbi:cupin domain-containing protein [Haloarchaeobius sp. DFWS5]|uniref:cupin domain-containing protein n=1 Tax=Haloarchaeobius sp. DFWS5 TaxID=3446114 RepID=UPI003EBC5BAF